jgi:hypothetical protein
MIGKHKEREREREREREGKIGKKAQSVIRDKESLGIEK